MSAPESSNSKAPPSLLSDKAKGAEGNGSRILANLEGRVAPPADKPRRSRTPLALVALLVIAAGGWGAWHMQQRTRTEAVASATPNNAEKVVPASAAGGAPQVTAKAAAPAAASSQAATIIADDNDSKAAAASAAAPASGDDSRLSRALAAGAEPSNASTPVASAPAASGLAVPSAKHGKNTTAVASNSKHETAAAQGKKDSATASASNRHASATSEVAQTRKSRTSKSGNESKDDSDADLLAALVARTKPADAKAAGGNAATKVSTSATPANAKLAERVKECGQRGFFEDQLCRWRVCDGHWGKDPACPGASSQARQP
ncbi:hypothetical protein [Paraburkholderia lacunae]|uniref:Uncharacterized protein n=1 Tax=Paraburkholderia lacunae TaxID=2211104 RepID=A0A370N2P6_9BURK|nr:hypothetical protein [Paraburkholderia lacunae]RDJ99898.1 hypothetical protein DLM46_26005 [Paraburkholderia lacunae]